MAMVNLIDCFVICLGKGIIIGILQNSSLVMIDPAALPKGQTINVGGKDDVSAVKKAGCCSS